MNVMAEKFDFERVGKRMPYTVPDGAFDELERNVWRKVAGNGAAVRCHRSNRLRIALRSAVAAAAVVAPFLAVNLHSDDKKAYDMNDVEQAFGNLSSEDKAYILQVYEEDLFINELY